MVVGAAAYVASVRGDKLECSEDGKRRWDERSGEYKLECSEDGKRRWDDQSDEYKLKLSEDGKQ